VITPPSGTRKLSKEEFARRFPAALDEDRLALSVLRDAYLSRDAVDAQCALIIGHVFGFTAEHEDLLCCLASEQWHTSHEDLVSALELGGFRDERCVEALYALTQFVPSYLEYDGSRALAVKATWALGKIPGRLSETKLNELASSPSVVLSQAAERQLRSR
jgi:hypothetical protein